MLPLSESLSLENLAIPDDLANSKSKDESKDEIWYPKVGDGYRQYKIYIVCRETKILCKTDRVLMCCKIQYFIERRMKKTPDAQ